MSSIYWSPATGPHEVFGAIRDKWASMGFERSVLGYPLVAEHDQTGGGRTQRFQGGVITWTGTGGAAEHEVSGDTVKFDSGQVNVPGALPLNGNVQLVVQRNGTFNFTTHAHDSGLGNISYAMAAVLVTSPGDAFQSSAAVTLKDSRETPSTLKGTTTFLPRDKTRPWPPNLMTL